MDMRAHIDLGSMDFTARVSGGQGFPAHMVPRDEAIPDYTGPYEVTPSDSEQALSTHGRTLRRDVVVAKIPSNWGRITWDGSVLTVS